MDEQLLNAVESKNIDLVRELLDKGANIETKNEKGQTPLFIACRDSDKEKEKSNDMVKLLLNRGANIEAKTIYDNTPLINSSDKNFEVVKMLLERGANVNAKNKDGWSSLMHASRNGKFETVKLLIQYGANIKEKDNEVWTALMLASRYSNTESNIETVKLLLENGANINEKFDNWTALIVAVRYSNTDSSIETVKLLLDNGADVFDKLGDQNIVDLCPTDECRELIYKYIWKRLYERDMETAKRYGKNVLSKDIWEIILLNKRQQQLCMKLSSEKNKEVLKYFAMELNIPVTENMTKAKLCGLISRYLAYNKYFSEKGKEYTETKLREEKQYIKDLASRYGLDRNKPIGELLKDLSYIIE